MCRVLMGTGRDEAKALAEARKVDMSRRNHPSTKGAAVLACVEKNCFKHPSTKGSAILACVEKYCFKHPSTKGAAIFGMCRKELLQASIDIFVTKNASRFADDLAMGTGIQNPRSKKGASPMGKK